MTTTLFRGGTAYTQGRLVRSDVLVRDGIVADLRPSIDEPADDTVDATDCIVTPGLIDTHTHVYHGAFRLGIHADRIAARSGTTTWVDAGTAGAGAFPGLIHQVKDTSRVRVVPFINLSFMGLANAGLMTREVGELWDASYADVRAILRANEENPGQIKGIKLRASSNALADNAASVLPQARFIADELDVPLMVHIGMSPPTIEEVTAHLVEGDILTHCFHPHAGGRITDRNGRLRPCVRDAIDRGVHLDVGHGVASISHRIVIQCLEQGVLPDSLSSDIHAENVGWPVRSQLTVIEMFLALGLSLTEVLERATSRPAGMIRQPELGVLQVGSAADLALLRLVDGSYEKQDSTGHTLAFTQRLECAGAYRDGVLIPPAEGPDEFRPSPWLTRFGAMPPQEEEKK